MTPPTLTDRLLATGLLGAGAHGADALRALLGPAPHPRCPGAVGVALALPRLAALIDIARVEGLPADIAASVPRRRLSYVAGRLCAEHALRRLGTGGPVGRGAGREPLWPAGVLGTITHTDATACALVAPAERAGRTEARYGLGIDSQTIVDEDGLGAVLSVCCTPAERGPLLEGFAAGERGLAGTIVFALKEAFYKAIHPTVGRFVDFDELEVQAIDIAAGVATLEPALPELASRAPFEGRFTIVDGEVHSLVELHHA
jgi:enterobactin synthetase component D